MEENRKGQKDRRRVIGLCGLAGSGKDEAAKALVNNGWHRLAFGDPMKKGLRGVDPLIPISLSDLAKYASGFVPIEVFQFLTGRSRFIIRVLWYCGLRRLTIPVRLDDLVSIIGWDIAKQIPEVRGLMQRYGTEGGRDVHGTDCWVDIARKEAQGKLDRQIKVVFTDVRFKNEADMVRFLGGYIVKIDRVGIHRCNGHSSEEYDFTKDITIINDKSIQSLRDAIIAVAESKE